MNTLRSACVLPGAGDADVKEWLKEYGDFTIVNKIDDADLLVFTGGSDVDPELYGEANECSMIDKERDDYETFCFKRAELLGIPMLGICRGSQFLHVMMGGKLWQDVTNHCCQHELLDLETNEIVLDTTSTHHQMVRCAAPATGFRLLAIPDTPRSDYYTAATEHRGGLETSVEVEAYKYVGRDADVLGIQGHPEWGGKDFAEWAMDKLCMFLLDAAKRDDRSQAQQAA